MSTGWIYLVASSTGALCGVLVNRHDRVAFGLGIATGVAFGFIAIYETAWPAVPGALLGIWTWSRRRRANRG
jgi:nicotinamide riboside transporter PnuC